MCSGQTWDVFYVVTTAAGDRLKFGITSGDPRGRLKTHRTCGYRNVALLLTGLPDGVASEIERSVMAALALAGERPIRGREYFDARVLGLVLDIATNYPIAEVAA
jgi:hypothetical protein